MLTQRLTVESAPLPSPRWVATAGKGGGRSANWTAGMDYKDLGLEFCCRFLIVTACTAASLTSTVTWADFHGLLWVRHRFVGSILAWHATCPLPTAASPPSGPSPAACLLRVITAAAAFWSCINDTGRTSYETTVRLPWPWHAVRGLMRSYRLSLRVLLVQLQYWCFRRDVAGKAAKC